MLENMPDDFMIKGFLMKNKAEVKRMCITEYDEEKTYAAFRKEYYEEGKMDMALKLLKRGKDTLEEISELTGFNVEKLKNLTDGNGNISFSV